MDINGFGETIRELFKKYRFVILILGIGIVLMVLPSGKSKQQTQTQTPSSQTAYFEDPTKELTEILSQIQGAGRVQLLLTRGSGERMVYQMDEEQEKSGEDQSIRVETMRTGPSRGLYSRYWPRNTGVPSWSVRGRTMRRFVWLLWKPLRMLQALEQTGYPG